MASMAKRIGKKTGKKRTQSVPFLPDMPDVIVKMIAIQGYTDPEIAFMCGVDPKIIKAWRKVYPSFDKALEEGRTIADVQVVRALHKKATGATITRDVAIKVKRGGKHGYKEDVEVHTITEELPPDTNAIKFWLTNRQKELWADRSHHSLSGKKDEPPVGVRDETKRELMSSILSLIQPKPDGD